MEEKLIFVSHPISGDIEGNMKKILKICSEVHSKDIIPTAPYLVSLQYLNDDIHEERQLGIDANLIFFHKRIIDEVWLFGDTISRGMVEEMNSPTSTISPLYQRLRQQKRYTKKCTLSMPSTKDQHSWSFS